MRAKGFVFALMMAVATGCGSDTKTESSGQASNQVNDNNTFRLSKEDLLGTWSSGCVLDPKRLGIYVKEYLQYDVDQVNRLTTSYFDRACSAEFFQQNLASTYQFSNQGVYTESRTSVALTVQSSNGIGMFNSGGGYCQVKDWKVNEEKTFADVTVCGINVDVKISLKAEVQGSETSLNARECEPRNPRDCTEMNYTRAN